MNVLIIHEHNGGKELVLRTEIGDLKIKDESEVTLELVKKLTWAPLLVGFPVYEHEVSVVDTKDFKFVVEIKINHILFRI